MDSFLFPFFLGILGASLGSFLHAAVLRVAEEKPFISERSICPLCKNKLAWYELVPLISYLTLRGKCGHCRKPISIAYFLSESVLFVVFFIEGMIWWQSNASVQFLARDVLAISVLAYLFIYDVKYYLLPDKVTIPAVLFLFLANLWLGQSLFYLAIGIFVGGGFFLLQFLVSRGKWVGGGDIRMGALLGALVGWPLIGVNLMLAYIVGTLSVLPLLLSGKKQFGSKIPFGTFLAISGVVTLWWGQPILDWYLSLL